MVVLNLFLPWDSPARSRGWEVAKKPSLAESGIRKMKTMEATEQHDSERGQIRAKLDAAVEKAKAVCERLEEKTVAAAKTADKTVREHPYQAIGIAFGLGLLIGVLAARSRRE